MPFNRARYVTVCQQFLVTFVVVVVGMSAAGVTTLSIVAPEGADHGLPAASGVPSRDLAPAVRSRGQGYADTAPVKPTVAEVEVAGVDRHAARTLPRTGVSSASERPATTAAKRTAASLRQAVLSRPEKVHGYATVGVTWAHGIALPENAISVQVRTEKNGVWSRWTVAPYHDDHGPDAGEADAARERPGTDAVVIGAVALVQMRALTLTGTAPADMRLALIDPGAGKTRPEAPAIDTSRIPASDTGATGAPVESTGTSPAGTSGALALSAMRTAPKPKIYSRAQWGADEHLRDQSAPSYGTVKTGFVHHTVDANNYTAAQVPALIRGIYAFHVEARGWRDIGYNYLVDRFGRIWEGRYGGVDRAVVGAHTLGYNEVSFAMSAIGNYQVAKPPQAVLDAYARLFAWKLSLYDIPANATNLPVRSRRLDAINGHRDVGQTECPGKYLYAQLPAIRTAARKIQLAAQTVTPTPTPTPTPAPVIPLPQQSPAAAVPQPSGMRFPVTTNLAGSAWPDLVLITAAGAISVLPTGGQVGYAAPRRTTGAWSRMSHVVAVGDVTGDGKGDVLGTTRSTGITRVYRGDGRGHVSTVGIRPTSALAGDDLVVGAGDLNGDHHVDLVVRDAATKRLYLQRGRGSGTFGPRVLMSTSWGGYRATAVPGDLTGDGHADLVALGTNALWLVPGLGGSRLGRPVFLATVAGSYRALVGSGDVTGDTLADLALQTSSGQTTIYPGAGHGRLGTPLGPFGSVAGLRMLSSAQMNGGASADLVGVDASGHLVVVAQNGRTNTAKPVSAGLRIPGVTQLLDVGDWNRDGKGDFITRQRDGDYLVLREGDGTGHVAASANMGAGWKSVRGLSAVGDVTGDGRPDLVGRNAAGTMLVFPGNGKTGFTRPLRMPLSLRTFNQVGTTPWQPSRAPANVLTSSDGSFVPFGGVDAAASMRAAGVDITRYDWVIGLGDVDGNGTRDLLVREKATGSLWLLPGAGSGFGPRRLVGQGFAGYRLAS